MTTAKSTVASNNVGVIVTRKGEKVEYNALHEIACLNQDLDSAKTTIAKVLGNTPENLTKWQAGKLSTLARQAIVASNALRSFNSKAVNLFESLMNTKDKAAQKAARSLTKAAINAALGQLLAKAFKRYAHGDTAIEFNGFVDEKSGYTIDSNLIIVDTTESSIFVDVTVTLNDERDSALGAITIKGLQLFIVDGSFTKESKAKLLDIAGQKVKEIGKKVA